MTNKEKLLKLEDDLIRINFPEFDDINLNNLMEQMMINVEAVQKLLANRINKTDQ